MCECRSVSTREDRLAVLAGSLHAQRSVLVAFSGGVDSTFLLAESLRVLGRDSVLAVTGVSPSLAADERAAAAELAATLGARHLEVETDEGEQPGYRANTGSRCYFCKSTLLDLLVPVAQEHGLHVVATGTNASDAHDPFRPGIRAADERGVLAPLRDAGLTKDDVRAASARLGLPTWDKPAAPCLASRIAYGVQVTPVRLARIERAEAAVRRAASAAGVPVRDLRVRDLGHGVRIELDAPAVPALAQVDLAALLSEFDGPVTLAPYRYGALNDALVVEQEA